MTTPSYYAPAGGLPPQTQLTTDRAIFTEAYAVLPRGTMTDIVTSLLPFWDRLPVHRGGLPRRRQRPTRAGPRR